MIVVGQAVIGQVAFKRINDYQKPIGIFWPPETWLSNKQVVQPAANDE